jgi:hypothetical protein
MNYEEFRAWRSDLLRQRSPRRLDCMNPEVALAHLRPQLTAQPASMDEIVQLWSKAVGVTLTEDRRVVGTGIRPILASLFDVIASRIELLWLPEDVYPVYWQLSSSARRCGFATVPDIDWRALEAAGPRDALLLPCPLSPVGRPFGPDERQRLMAWLDAQPARMLILDHAYSFATASHLDIDELWTSERTVSIWSMSKPWLSRGVLGLASAPPSFSHAIQAHVPVPSPSELTRALALLSAAPELPQVLQQRFRSAWERLLPTIRSACPAWRPPNSGYFSVLPMSFTDLLARYDLLAIPVTVFGSRRSDLSIASCLYDIELNEGRLSQ